MSAAREGTEREAEHRRDAERGDRVALDRTVDGIARLVSTTRRVLCQVVGRFTDPRGRLPGAVLGHVPQQRGDAVEILAQRGKLTLELRARRLIILFCHVCNSFGSVSGPCRQRLIR
jgi:hypothetical protein